MCFDSSSTLLATASSDYTCKVWDIQAQYCTHNLKGAQGLIHWVQFYPDIQQKQQLLTAADDGKIRVYNLNNSKMEACLEGHFSAVTKLEYLLKENTTNTYDRLLSCSRDKVLIIWDLENFTKLRTIPLYESIESILLDSEVLGENTSEKFVITLGNEGLLKLWDLKTGRNVFKQSEQESLKFLSKKESSQAELDLVIEQGLYNKKTNTLFLVSTDQLIVFVRLNVELFRKLNKQAKLEEGEFSELFNVYKQYVGDNGEILDIQYCNLKENLLAVATNSEFLKIYDLNTWDCKLLKGHTDLVICLSSFTDKHSNKSYLASSSKDNTIRLWRIEDSLEENGNYTFECISVLHGHTQDVGALCFSRLSLEFLVSASIDTTIKHWKISKAKKDEKEVKLNVHFTVKAHEKDINSVCVSPNDKLIASGSSDKVAKIWDANDGSCLAVLRGHKRGIWSVQFSPVDQLVATSSADATIKIWSLADFSCVKVISKKNSFEIKIMFISFINVI